MKIEIFLIALIVVSMTFAGAVILESFEEIETTFTEETLSMCLPTDLRNLPGEEVIAGQTFRAGINLEVING